MINKAMINKAMLKETVIKETSMKETNAAAKTQADERLAGKIAQTDIEKHAVRETEILQAVQSVMAQMKKDGTTEKQEQGLKKMTLKMAETLIAKVKEKAALMGVKAVVAVADAAARPVAVHCMDDAFIASFDIALNKAYTCASLKMSTARLGALSQPGQPLYGIQFTNGGKIVIFGGGEVLEIQGNIIGALGVSGGTAQEDTALAAYGREIFEEVTACL